MRKSLRQSITGYRMPIYMQDILSNHYCPNFLKMTIVNNCSTYMFYYETGVMRRLEYVGLSTREKLELLRSVIAIIFENREWLIGPESYLIEPELIYSMDNSVEYGRIGLLFYPDFKGLDEAHKLALFADKLKNSANTSETDIIEQFKNAVLVNDTYRAQRILERNINRLGYVQVV